MADQSRSACFVDRVFAVTEASNDPKHRRGTRRWADKGRGHVLLAVSDNGKGRCTIEAIIACPEGHRIGTRLMKLLVKIADETETVLALTPRPIDENVFSENLLLDLPREDVTEVERLARWYAHFGFRAEGTQMVREPSRH